MMTRHKRMILPRRDGSSQYPIYYALNTITSDISKLNDKVNKLNETLIVVVAALKHQINSVCEPDQNLDQG
jgi:hypothetical protein